MVISVIYENIFLLCCFMPCVKDRKPLFMVKLIRKCWF